MGFFPDKKAASWALYDWANSAFATTVMAGFFPVFFKDYWCAGVDAATSTFRLGAANSAASLLVLVMAPALGAIADAGGARKKFLLFFATVGIVATAMLYFVSRGEWGAAAAVYVLGSVGFNCSILFYDSLLVDVGPPEKYDYLSALGYALGYLGGGLLFAQNVLMATKPEMFGVAGPAEAIRVSFVLVALWWAVFTIPLALNVTERPARAAVSRSRMVSDGIRRVGTTFREIRRYKTVFLFLIAYWLYIDGVDTIIRMAVDYGLSIGFSSSSLILALLIVQFVGFPAAIAFGKIGEKIGAKNGIYIGIAVYLGVTVWGYFMKNESEFYVLAVAVGLVQGGVQSLSRSYFARIIPPERAGEFFGFYNLLGKFAAVIGPVLMGWTALAFAEPRYAILSVAVLFVGGGAVLYFVDEKAAADSEAS
ncbi:MAG: MFS transporter [Syntrophobacteraceae bacterium]